MTVKNFANENFEQNYPVEIERKFLPHRPEKLDKFYRLATPIEQAYLSHQDDAYSLRIRRSEANGNIIYTPTLKDRGEIIDGALVRLEANGRMTQQRYDYYRADDLPTVEKMRYERDGVAIDFYDQTGSDIIVESESPEGWRRFLAENDLTEDDFEDVTGSKIADNEWRAHENYRKRHSGRDAFEPPTKFDPDEMAETILARHESSPLVATLGGRSGSGKTTLLKYVAAQIQELGFTTSTLSTDDYNKGRSRRTRLADGEWANYDANETYDLPLCYLDLKRLKNGLTIARRTYDFETEEPVVSGTVTPTDVTLVEGIKAQHPLIMEAADLSFTMPTSLALSIGRRIMRDLRERPRFADPGTNLSVYLEYAEPEYRALLENL